MRRFELLEDLWYVAIFLQDAATIRAAALDALAVAESTSRPDLAAEARIGLAAASHVEGECGTSLAGFRGAIGSTRERPSLMVGLASILLYHVGAHAEGEGIMRRMSQVAADLGDISTQVVLVANLGLTLSGQGRYGEALESFEHARGLATRHGLKTLLARSVSMSAGYPLDVYDFAECTRRAEETAELGRALEFATPRVNAGLDLAFVAARSGKPEQALALVGAIEGAIAGGRGFHGWIWRSRMAVLFAEVLAARADWVNALDLADGCIAGCRPLLRVKYRLLAEHVRSRALDGLGRRDEAVAAARASLVVARGYPDPAMKLRAAATLLALTADEAARTDLVDAAGVIERGLLTEAARAIFRGAAPLSHVG
jgi:tetratricopeptide (TPR) repeat protein